VWFEERPGRRKNRDWSVTHPRNPPANNGTLRAWIRRAKSYTYKKLEPRPARKTGLQRPRASTACHIDQTGVITRFPVNCALNRKHKINCLFVLQTIYPAQTCDSPSDWSAWTPDFANCINQVVIHSTEDHMAKKKRESTPYWSTRHFERRVHRVHTSRRRRR
jgi:hypothetical protein